MGDPAFVYVTFIRSTPEKVWQALTDGKFTEQFWYGRRVESDWKVGSPVAFWFNGEQENAGKILECDPPRRLAYTFHPAKSAKPELHAEGPSRAAFDIEQQGPVVRLQVTHDQFPPNSKMRVGVSTGWPAIIASLKSLLETGEPLPRDTEVKRLEAIGGRVR